MGGHGKIYIIGEVTSKATPIYRTAIEGIVRDIAGEDIQTEFNIVSQSPEIARGVDTGGAGDQGIMVGYACNENKEMIPQELYLARSLCRYIYERVPQDGKTQVTLDQFNQVQSIVASFCHETEYRLSLMVRDWFEHMQLKWTPGECNIFCNPAGDWDQGGFEADTGLTGRKLAVDNYGPGVPIGGGAFSGKDATKVDRSAAYMARRIAVDLLKKNQAKEVIVKLAYSIGIAKPVMATAQIDDRIVEIDIDKVDLSPKSIIDELGLREPIFEQTAKWGHFGRKFNWDKEREIRGFDNVDLVVDWPIKE